MKYFILLLVNSALLCSGVGIDDYKEAAEAGDAVAQRKIGQLYNEGISVDQDFSEAVKWYRKAAGHGDADAQLNLGYMYANGKGVKENDAEALCGS